ncbi:hypothetical protein [Occallatibacter riparius]|uniref:Uncharacterized protein n=1 Tax=Occallatibacter riparius TaxID=1002689 RepID=A0A9J7BYC6_9BACT|nr:hypothetical protein [Occallatibacter riparius]UWZ86413.1 hypothetical protein MOP44_10820 [Occallatibacter riparius]
MDTPRLSERVRVRGQQDKAFIVIKVDEEARTVDLVPASGAALQLNDVPFSDLQRKSTTQ